MTGLLYGMITMGFLIAALFFVRFWRRTADPLFATFALAFVLLAGGGLLAAPLVLTVPRPSWRVAGRR